MGSNFQVIMNEKAKESIPENFILRSLTDANIEGMWCSWLKNGAVRGI